MSPNLVVGPFHGAFEAELDGQRIDGLVDESTYLWGVLRTRSSEQAAERDVFQVMRRVSDGASWPKALMVQSNVGAAGIRRHPTDLRAAPSASIVRGSTPNGPRFDAPGDDSEPFELAVDDDRVRWSEGALLSLDGAEVRPGLQWCLVPGPDGGMRYGSRIFQVSGSVDGADVDGFIGMDTVQLLPDRQNYIDDPITAGHLSRAWCTWATAYDDGSVEAGHAAFGPDGFGFALVADGQTAHVSTSVDGTVVANEAGIPTHLEFVVADGGVAGTWHFDADDRSAPLESLPGPVRQSEGWYRRADETRRPIVWCATPEIPAPPHGG